MFVQFLSGLLSRRVSAFIPTVVAPETTRSTIHGTIPTWASTVRQFVPTISSRRNDETKRVRAKKSFFEFGLALLKRFSLILREAYDSTSRCVELTINKDNVGSALTFETEKIRCCLLKHLIQKVAVEFAKIALTSVGPLQRQVQLLFLSLSFLFRDRIPPQQLRSFYFEISDRRSFVANARTGLVKVSFALETTRKHANRINSVNLFTRVIEEVISFNFFPHHRLVNQHSTRQNSNSSCLEERSLGQIKIWRVIKIIETSKKSANEIWYENCPSIMTTLDKSLFHLIDIQGNLSLPVNSFYSLANTRFLSLLFLIKLKHCFTRLSASCFQPRDKNIFLPPRRNVLIKINDD